jgi:peptidoglycan DL-endopeptidase CwlO
MGLRSALRPLSVAAVAAVVAVALIGGSALSGDVSAQDVGGLQATADKLARELDQLESKASQLDEDYLNSGQQLAKVQTEIDQNTAAVADAQQRMDAARARANSYLVSAYMGAGSGSQVALGTGDPNEAVNQKVLLETLQGDQQQVADDLRGARMDLADRTSELRASTKELAAQRDKQKAIKSQLESSVAKQQALLQGANAELRSAIQAQQARREAEAAARAAAQAQQAAAEQAAAQAQQAAAQQAAAQQAATKPGTAPKAAKQPAGTTTTAAAPQGSQPAPAARPALPTAAPKPPPAPVSAPNPRAGAAIAAAQSVLGTPYRWAGAGPGGFDCSGLTMWAWSHAGVGLPHSSGAQYGATQRVPIDQLQPGDLVFFGSPIHHVGLYIGGGQMIHAPHTGDVVRVASIYSGGGNLVGGGRVR